MKKRIISLLLVCMMILSLLPMSVLAVDTVPGNTVAYVTNAEGAPVDAGGEGAGGEGSGDLGGGYYSTLAAAVAAAAAGNTVSIVKEGTYPIPNPIDGVVIYGAVAGGKEKVTFDASKQTGQLAKTDGEITFKNVTFNFGTANYTGFQHPGKITFDNCDLNGFLTTYGDMTFKDCKLTSGNNQYAINFYGGSNFNLSNCHFYGVDKNVYIYQECLDGDKNVTFTSCDFHMSGSGDTKSAVMLNAPVTWGNHAYNVVLSSCTTEGGMNTTAAKNVAGNTNYQGLYGLKHVNGSGNPSLILGSVTINDAVVYSCPNFEKDEVTLFTADDLMAFAAEVKKGTSFSGKTVKLGADIDLEGETWPMINGAGKNITFDGQSHTISNMVTPFEHDAGFFKTGSGCTIKNVNFDNAVVVGIGRLGVVCGHGMCVKIENCKVTNSTVTAVVTNNDDGDKAGAICGYLSGEPNASVTGCTVDGCTITGYRDVGGAVGYAGGTYTVSGNTVKNTTVYFDKESNYNKYSEDSEFDAKAVIGDQGSAGTVNNNTAENVTVKVLTAGTVDVGEGDKDAEVIVEQKSEVDLSGEGVAEEIESLTEETKNAITSNTAVTGVKLTTEAAGGEEKSGLQAVVDAAVKKNTELAAAIAEAETVNIEVKVNVVPTEFKTATATQGEEEVIGTVTFELKPTATVTIGEGNDAKSETVDVDNSMIDTSKPITVSIYTGFEPVKIVHTGNDNFEEVFRKTGDKTFTYEEGVCTLTIIHFSELKAVAKVYVAEIDENHKYETLQDAVNAAGTESLGTTITLLDDVVLTTGVVIPENKNITINGNGKTITIDDGKNNTGTGIFGNAAVSTEGLKGTTALTVSNVRFVSAAKGEDYAVTTGSGFNGKVALDNCSFKDMYTAVYMNPNGAAEAELSITNCEYANTTWGYSVDTVSSPGIDKVNVKTTFTGNEIDAAKTFEIFGVAAIYEGDKQIGQYRTLAEAITAVANGENKVITVLPGTIKIGPTETLTLASAGITLKGVRGEKGEYLSKIIRDQIPSGNNMFIYVNAANITFEDLYIEYATNDDAWNQRNPPILTSAAADNFTMKYCYLKGPDKANMLLNPGDGADNGLIEGNTFEGGSSGIYIRPCSGTVIKNNTFINNGKCITFEPGETTCFQNVQVSGNTFNIDRKGGTVTGGSRGDTGDYASTIGIKIFPEVKNTTNQGWGDGNSISGNTFVNNSGEATYVAYAVIPRSGANDNYTNELIDRISDSFKTDNILPAGALMGYKEVGTTNAATQFSPIVYVAPSGGGGGVASYAVSAASATHGKVTVDKASASAGSTVTITVAPDKGFTLETLTVKDAKGNEVALTAVKAGETYTFKMPAGKVTISATFMEDNTMLNFFVDVKADDYFYDAVLWATKNGITLGVDDTHFAPMAITTRGQMVTFLWRAAGCPEPTEVTCEFTDVKASEYYYKAVLWAVETGITKGTSDTTFSPDANVSRSQTVTFLARMSGVKDDAAGYSHNFADVSAADYFNNAVAWAATNKITEGTSATTFSPNDDCLRGQIVTFLYRNFVK